MKLCGSPAGRFELRSALLCAGTAEKLFFISRLSRSAERDKRLFTRRGRNGKRQLLRWFPSETFARRAYPFRLLTPFAATFPKGTASVAMGTFISTTKGVPLRAGFPRPGEDVTAGDKKGNLALRSKD